MKICINEALKPQPLTRNEYSAAKLLKFITEPIKHKISINISVTRNLPLADEKRLLNFITEKGRNRFSNNNDQTDLISCSITMNYKTFSSFYIFEKLALRYIC